MNAQSFTIYILLSLTPSPVGQGLSIILGSHFRTGIYAGAQPMVHSGSAGSAPFRHTLFDECYLYASPGCVYGSMTSRDASPDNKNIRGHLAFLAIPDRVGPLGTCSVFLYEFMPSCHRCAFLLSMVSLQYPENGDFTKPGTGSKICIKKIILGIPEPDFK